MYPRDGLSLIRTGIGLTFLMSAVQKTLSGWLLTPDHLVSFVQRQQAAAVAPYGAFLQEIVLPNAGLFAQLVVLGEWVAGVSLALGLFTRLGAISAFWLNGNYLLSKGPLTTDASADRIYMLSALVVAAVAADLAWSADRALSSHHFDNPLARWLAGHSPRKARPSPFEIRGRRGRESRAA
ncbi:MAG TPA: DoxX family protein [Chloroflexota bacterium]|nr:DoxX family protein [Chloroflexota bacterium]